MPCSPSRGFTAQFVEIYGTVSDVNANNVPTDALFICPVALVPCPPVTYSALIHGNRPVAGGGVIFNFLHLPGLVLHF